MFMSGDPGTASGSTTGCPWLWSTLPAYWPMCRFDLILAIHSALTNITAHHLPLFQCRIAIVFWIKNVCVSCVGFVVLSVQCYFAIFSDLYCCIAYDEATALGNVPLCLNFQGFKVSNKQTLSWGNNILVCVDIFKFVKFQHSSSLAFTYLNILFY